MTKSVEEVNCIHLVPPSVCCNRYHCVVPNVGEGDCHIFLDKGDFCSFRVIKNNKRVGEKHESRK